MSQSAYFDRALSGQWTEATTRRMELTVEDEQELEDLKLLIKLCYSDSFAHDGGRLLPWATRVRLAVLADGFELVEAVKQVVESLPLVLSFEAAQVCLDGLPPALEAHPSMAGVRNQVVELLVSGIQGRLAGGCEGATKRDVAALARVLGPVAGMFEGGKSEDGPAMVLREDVKQLPICVLKRLLASDALQLQVEDEAYALLVGWLSSKTSFSRRERSIFFEQAAPVLRYHHMTTAYLANVILATVVCTCAFMKKSKLLPTALSSALAQSGVLRTFVRRYGAAAWASSRGVPPSKASWTVKASFTLEEVQTLALNGHIKKFCGSAAGYPAVLRVSRDVDDDVCKVMFGLKFVKSGPEMDSGPDWGVALRVTFNTAFKNRKIHYCFRAGKYYGYDIPREPWAEVVREGKPEFMGGKLEVSATVRLVRRPGKWEDDDEGYDEDE